jgi:hypothetical protein
VVQSRSFSREIRRHARRFIKATRGSGGADEGIARHGQQGRNFPLKKNDKDDPQDARVMLKIEHESGTSEEK